MVLFIAERWPERWLTQWPYHLRLPQPKRAREHRHGRQSDRQRLSPHSLGVSLQRAVVRSRPDFRQAGKLRF
jgi:hypothetical protein